MSFLSPRVALVWTGAWLALHASPTSAQDPAPNAPEHLVLRFDPSAANLNQSAIYAAVAEEVHLIVADEGSEQAATLTVSVTSGGDIQLIYRPAHETVARTIPVTNTSNVPRLIGHLAGNMVRDEASSVLATLGPDAAPPAPQATPEPAQPATIAIRPHTLDPWRNDPESASDAPYLQDKWITTVMFGSAIDALPQTRIAVHQTKRFDRLEIGVGLQFDLGRTRTGAGDHGAYQVTLPVSAEYRALGANEGYLQLGTSFGLRVGQLLDRKLGARSDAHAQLAIDLHVTAGFATARDQGVLIRAGIGVLPNRFDVWTDRFGHLAVDPMQPTLQLGYQAGW